MIFRMLALVLLPYTIGSGSTGAGHFLSDCLARDAAIAQAFNGKPSFDSTVNDYVFLMHATKSHSCRSLTHALVSSAELHLSYNHSRPDLRLSSLELLEPLKLCQAHTVFLSGHGWKRLDSISMFPNAKLLDLSRNNLQSFPDKENSRHLKSLNLDHNRFTSLESISRFPQLTRLSAAANCLSTIDGIQRLKSLRYASFEYNPFHSRSYVFLLEKGWLPGRKKHAIDLPQLEQVYFTSDPLFDRQICPFNLSVCFFSPLMSTSFRETKGC